MANMVARSPMPIDPLQNYVLIGGFAEKMDESQIGGSKATDFYDAPQWWRQNIHEIF